MEESSRVCPSLTSEYNAVYTVQLGELMDEGVFDWSMPELDWSAAAYSPEQYARMCAYIADRYRYREISMLPPKQWFLTLKTRLSNELCPKYAPLYKALENGFDPLQRENRYYKGREIGSAYPETMLSGNSDYISDGRDKEEQTVIEGEFTDYLLDYAQRAQGVDKLFADELESLFIGTYTASINALW